MKNPKTFKVYAQVRATRQLLGDRIEEIRQADWKNPLLKTLDEVYDLLDSAEGKLEGIGDNEV